MIMGASGTNVDGYRFAGSRSGRNDNGRWLSVIVGLVRFGNGLMVWQGGMWVELSSGVTIMFVIDTCNMVVRSNLA